MYSRADLSVAIPTLGRDLALLVQILTRLQAEQLVTIVVWDGHCPPAPEQEALIRQLGATLLVHERNRGLSAGRNTGAHAMTTALGMYIDDDIVPAPGFAQAVIDFHNQHPDLLTMMMGCVTWRGGPHQTALTEWFETRGNWNVFHTVPEGRPHANFMGGFTSFKTAVLDDLQFDERFLRYGCEDVEFGYRFFARGGQLLSWPRVLGVHVKQLSPGDYLRDHLGAGYSRGVLVQRQPDAAFSLAWTCKALNTTLPRDALDQIAGIAANLIHIGAGLATQELDLVMRLLTEQAIQTGFVEFLTENFPSARALRERALAGEPLDEQTVIDGIEDFAPLLVERARRCGDPQTRTALRARSQMLIPHYAAPLLDACAAGDDERARIALREHLASYGKDLDLRTIQMIRSRLGEEDDTLATGGTRALYVSLRSAEATQDTARVVTLAQSILELDPGHAGACIAWARAILKTDAKLARVLLGQARHHVGFRPLHEQETRLPEIAALLHQANQTHAHEA
ncbi:glycosyltransferase [Niveibacterium sp. 24ML]|uniref:glycosyltransferase family 2 protein n=1 Tax=Niveibacterium sp. 24ML TaxID=2985512 RepID=UPI00227181AE|nr:glycosyltransferase [Niveibacterium sp. 24ML]MCX9156187.1 glycosyltransferase [Niveibacterium sp. 24ML]